MVTVGDHDAQYLLDHLDRLLGKPIELCATTLDLVVDRASGRRMVQLRLRRAEAAPSVIEVTLDGSTFDSVPMRVAMDHHLLLNALRFGHRHIHLQSATGPVFCRDRGNNFVWALMHDSLTTGQVSKMQTVSTSHSLIAA